MMDEWLINVFRAVSPATILGCIFAGVIFYLIYWRKIKVSVYNAFMYNFTFFAVMYVVRRFVDGRDTAAAYVGLYILFSIFMLSAWFTKIVYARFIGKY